ncbi:intercellular trafficking and secretion [Purpureocillium takamizusanense]|uniref:Sorting nexin-4 n=1 Tax=Purpureocillium takamizusanense TaxID=2060973 RepID=A0A9Q8VEV8_9HYPO|nr:intercellular trafficking and secretion [Purpureocillium takamizusanense]UNI23028.1 intercellular trafficking and secretion [Purpureocillium takamizusanense]
MADEHENFSNVSWSEHVHDQTSRLPPAEEPGHTMEGPSTGIEDEPPLGNERLECAVGTPLKENDGSKDAFVSYLITTHSTFPSFQRSTVSVRRRFTDFVFLFKQLSRDFPAAAVPPLPDKQRMEYVRGDRFGGDFTARRAHSLQRFLRRLALHPTLRRAAILHAFLESPDWNATVRSRSTRASLASDGGPGGGGGGGGGGSGGVFDNFADTFINAFTKVHKPDRRFIEVKDKSDKLDEDLGHIEKVVARVVRREADLEADMRDLAEQFQKLITLEPGVEPAVHAFAASVEDTAAGLRGLRDVTDQDYLGSLRDMQAYSLSLKALLRAREQKQLDHEQLTEYLNKSTAERDALASGGHGGGGGGGGASGLVGGLGGNFIRSKIEDVRGVDHEQARRERARKLELRVEELTTEVERARRTSDMFDDEVVREVADFERIKRCEFKAQLGGLADAHVAFYGDVADIWERYVREMEREGGLAAAA